MSVLAAVRDALAVPLGGAAQLELAILGGAIGLVLASGVGSAARAVATARAWGRDTWVPALVVCAVAAALQLGVVPPAPWEPGVGGVSAWARALGGSVGDLGDPTHGPAAGVVWRLVAPWTPAAVRPWGAGVVVTTVTGLLVVAWLRAWTGSAAAAALGAATLLWSPAHLRLAAGLSSVVVCELGLAVALLAHAGWRGGGGGAAWWGVVGGGLLAASARSEVVPWVPALWGAAALHAGLHRREGVVAALGVGLVLLRGGDAPWAGLTGPLEGMARVPALGGVLVALAGAAVLGRRGIPGATATRALVGVGLVGGVAVAPWTFVGVWPAWAPAVEAALRAWPPLHPYLTPPALWCAAVVGLARLGREAPAAAALSLGSAALLAWLAVVVAGEEGTAGYLRASALLSWPLVVWVAAAVPAGGGGGGPGLTAALAGLFVVGPVAAWRLNTHEFPEQTEARLLFEEVRPLGIHGRVAFLAPDDVSPPVRRDDLGDARADLRALLTDDGAPVFYAVGDMLRDPDEAVGALWLRGLSCFRAVPAQPDGRLRTWGDFTEVVYGAGRAWAYAPPTSPPPGQRARPESPLWVTPERLPCLYAPAPGTCALDTPEGCLVWRCPEDATLAPRRPGYLDPRCVDMERRFILEPVVERQVNPGSLGGARSQLLEPRPTIGLYRITGVRSR